MKDFELSFSDFIDSTEYDKAEGAVFSLVRLAYKAGWLAAGGESLASSKPLSSGKYASPPEDGES